MNSVKFQTKTGKRDSGTRMVVLLSVLLSASVTCAASESTAIIDHSTVLPAEERPLATLPYAPSLDIQSMDIKANPCEDFYQYSCGGWVEHNPIPADQSNWSVYGKLYDDNQRFLWGILQELAKSPASNSPVQQQLGDYFAACMDDSTIAAQRDKGLQALFERIDAMKTRKELPQIMATLHKRLGSAGLSALNVNQFDYGVFFSLSAAQDYSDSTRLIAFAKAGGLGLPDRDYYVKPDAKSRSLRASYQQHVAQMLELTGTQPDQAKSSAHAIVAMETELAKASLSAEQQRDPYKLFHKMKSKDLQALTPGFSWSEYFQQLGVPKEQFINVTEPKFYKALGRVWQNQPLNDLKMYLRWHSVHAVAPFLSPDFANADFEFYGRTLRGTPSSPARWKSCVSLADAQLGESLGQEFVSRTFSPELKQKTLTMTRQIEQAMREDLNQLSWMSAQTKKRAIEKLDAIVNKVGFPDQWRDYSSIHVDRQDFLGNVMNALNFEEQRQLHKIGKPLDHLEWGMTPPTVNAYYDPQMNDINFPAGVLQPPLFDPKMDDAPNYGNTGGTIGHELTHAFDDEGRQFDGKGNLKDWWGKMDGKAFEERAQCIVDQYGQYNVIDDIHINSKLTEGEDIADLGGLVLAWMAWKTETGAQHLEMRDGLTPEQRFFVGYAQWACGSARPEDERLHALTNPHSPGKFRVNGLMVNMPEFQAAFSCKAGQAMVKPRRCRVW